MRVHKLGSLLLSAAVAAFTAGQASAASSEIVAAGEARVRLLVSGNSDTNSAPVFRGGVEVVLTSGWKTYWRYPGDAGIPPRFDWSGSQNVASVEVLYPAPTRITDGSGQTSIGYKDRVIFPLRIHAKDPAEPVTLKLKLDFATCEKLCIPAEARVSLAFSSDAPKEAILDEAERAVPQRNPRTHSRPLAIVEAKVERGIDPAGKDARILVKAISRTNGELDLFAEGPNEEWTLALPQVLRKEAGYTIFAIPLENSRLGKTEIPPKVVLTLVAEDQALETVVPLD